MSKRAEMKYRIDTNKHIPLTFYVAINSDHTKVSALSNKEYDSLIERRKESEPKKTTKQDAVVPDNTKEAKIDMDFGISDYNQEEAKFITANAELDALISQEAIVNNPILGYYHDPSSVRFAKLKYLLKSWTLFDVDLVTLYDVEQLNSGTMNIIKKDLPTVIIAKLLQMYDEEMLT